MQSEYETILMELYVEEPNLSVFQFSSQPSDHLYFSTRLEIDIYSFFESLTKSLDWQY